VIVDRHALEIATQIYRLSLFDLLTHREPADHHYVTNAEMAEAILESFAGCGEEEFADIEALATADAIEVYYRAARY
jgi:hypothetical protein